MTLQLVYYHERELKSFLDGFPVDLVRKIGKSDISRSVVTGKLLQI